jgi:hypothetical protein
MPIPSATPELNLSGLKIAAPYFYLLECSLVIRKIIGKRIGLALWSLISQKIGN